MLIVGSPAERFEPIGRLCHQRQSRRTDLARHRNVRNIALHSIPVLFIVQSLPPDSESDESDDSESSFFFYQKPFITSTPHRQSWLHGTYDKLTHSLSYCYAISTYNVCRSELAAGGQLGFAVPPATQLEVTQSIPVYVLWMLLVVRFTINRSACRASLPRPGVHPEGSLPPPGRVICPYSEVE